MPRTRPETHTGGLAENPERDDERNTENRAAASRGISGTARRTSAARTRMRAYASATKYSVNSGGL